MITAAVAAVIVAFAIGFQLNRIERQTNRITDLLFKLDEIERKVRADAEADRLIAEGRAGVGGLRDAERGQ